MIPVEISLRSPTHTLHKTLPLHQHTISSSSTGRQRCIFSWERMRVSTAYVRLYHPGKSWSEELSLYSVLSSMLPQFCDQHSSQTLKTKFESSAGFSSPLVALPGTKVCAWASTFNSQPSPTPPTSRYFLEMPPGIKCFPSIN